MRGIIISCNKLTVGEDMEKGPRAERVSNPEESASENPWAEAMGEVDDFSTHIAKMEAQDETTPSSRAQTAMEMIGVVETRKDGEQFEAALEKLDAKTALRILSLINGTLTGTRRSERTAIGSEVWGGAEVAGHLSPAVKVQSIAVGETLDAIKGIKDEKKRAALAYYMINHLHIFGDGNGRTARATYEILTSEDFQLGDKAFTHQTGDESEVGGGEEFAKEHGLQPVAVVSDLAFGFVKEDLARDSQLPRKMSEISSRLKLPRGARPMPDVYLTRDAERGLDPAEKTVVRHAFYENQIATTALGIMLKKKFTDGDVIEESTRKDFPSGKEYILFEVEKKDGEAAKETFDGWVADDYREFCRVVVDLQLRQARKLIDIFKNEDKYRTAGGQTYAEWLSGQH